MSKDMLARTVARPGFVKDPLLKEIRAYRDRYAAEFNYDNHAMGHELRKREKNSGRKLSKLSIRRVLHKN